MAQPAKRTKIAFKCPNPLFIKWLEEWKEEATAKNSNLQYCYGKALKSLKKFPIPIKSGKECLILENFGPGLCKKLDAKLEEYREDHPACNDEDTSKITPSTSVPTDNNKPNASKANKKRKQNKERTSPAASPSSKKQCRAYVPVYRSGPYAILITLLKNQRKPNYPGFMTKAELQKSAEPLCDASFYKPDPGSHYTAWSSMSTLIKKTLVSKTGQPARYSLTVEGSNLAKQLEESDSSDTQSAAPKDCQNQPSSSVVSYRAAPKKGRNSRRSPKKYSAITNTYLSDEEDDPDDPGSVNPSKISPDKHSPSDISSLSQARRLVRAGTAKTLLNSCSSTSKTTVTCPDVYCLSSDDDYNPSSRISPIKKISYPKVSQSAPGFSNLLQTEEGSDNFDFLSWNSHKNRKNRREAASMDISRNISPIQSEPIVLDDTPEKPVKCPRQRGSDPPSTSNSGRKTTAITFSDSSDSDPGTKFSAQVISDSLKQKFKHKRKLNNREILKRSKQSKARMTHNLSDFENDLPTSSSESNQPKNRKARRTITVRDDSALSYSFSDSDKELDILDKLPPKLLAAARRSCSSRSSENSLSPKNLTASNQQEKSVLKPPSSVNDVTDTSKKKEVSDKWSSFSGKSPNRHNESSSFSDKSPSRRPHSSKNSLPCKNLIASNPQKNPILKAPSSVNSITDTSKKKEVQDKWSPSSGKSPNRHNESFSFTNESPNKRSHSPKTSTASKLLEKTIPRVSSPINNVVGISKEKEVIELDPPIVIDDDDDNDMSSPKSKSVSTQDLYFGNDDDDYFFSQAYYDSPRSPAEQEINVDIQSKAATPSSPLSSSMSVSKTSNKNKDNFDSKLKSPLSSSPLKSLSNYNLDLDSKQPLSPTQPSFSSSTYKFSCKENNFNLDSKDTSSPTQWSPSSSPSKSSVCDDNNFDVEFDELRPIFKSPVSSSPSKSSKQQKTSFDLECKLSLSSTQSATSSSPLKLSALDRNNSDSIFDSPPSSSKSSVSFPQSKSSVRQKANLDFDYDFELPSSFSQPLSIFEPSKLKGENLKLKSKKPLSSSQSSLSSSIFKSPKHRDDSFDFEFKQPLSSSQSSLSSLASKSKSKKDILELQSEQSITSSQSTNSSSASKSSAKKERSQKSSSCTQSSSQAEDFLILMPDTFEVILLVDNAETNSRLQKPFLLALDNNKTKYEIRHLKVGDYLWIARDRISGAEVVLPYIVERKRMDDLAGSIKDGRFHEQKLRLKQSGITNLIYLVERYGGHFGLPETTVHQAAVNTYVVDNFQLKYTSDYKHSAAYLSTLSSLLSKRFKDKTIVSCDKSSLPAFDVHSDFVSLMTFKDFSKGMSKIRNYTVKEMFIKQLLQLYGMSVEKAMAITDQYPTPKSLLSAFKRGGGQDMLASITFGPTKRTIGPALSKHVFQLYTLKTFP